MGILLVSKSSFDSNVNVNQKPNHLDYQILESIQCDNYLIVKH